MDQLVQGTQLAWSVRVPSTLPTFAARKLEEAIEEENRLRPIHLFARNEYGRILLSSTHGRIDGPHFLKNGRGRDDTIANIEFWFNREGLAFHTLRELRESIMMSQQSISLHLDVTGPDGMTLHKWAGRIRLTDDGFPMHETYRVVSCHALMQYGDHL